MGQVAAERSDVVIVTDDNPRSEVPAAIRQQVLAGANEVATSHDVDIREEGDRRTAIELAIHIATPSDIVAVLGKGHETGQEIAGVVHPFDDRVVIGEVAR
jgi:UDP-N-acetylmuramoyl-L-alanyl-D-glutamate--2,6-diaminopimelate ligase